MFQEKQRCVLKTPKVCVFVTLIDACVRYTGEQSVQPALHHRTHQTQHTNKTTPVQTGFVPLVYSYGTVIKQHPLQGYLLNPSVSFTLSLLSYQESLALRSARPRVPPTAPARTTVAVGVRC